METNALAHLSLDNAAKGAVERRPYQELAILIRSCTVFAAYTAFLVMGFLLTASGCVSPTKPLAPAPSRVGRWQQDVEYLGQNLPRLHKNAFHSISKESFESSVRELRDEVGLLTDHEIIVRIMQLVAAVGDGHTGVGGETGFGTWPVRFHQYSDGIFIVLTSDAHAEALGARVVAIDGTPIADAMRAVETVVPHDNSSVLYAVAAGRLTFPEVLHALGITKCKDTCTLDVYRSDGTSATIRLVRADSAAQIEWRSVWDFDDSERPLSRRHRKDPYAYSYVPENSLLYIAYNSCVNRKDKPFKRFVIDVLRVADANRPRRVVVDLRRNAGGNSEVINPLIRGLRKRSWINRPDRLFCLIDGYTYSSDMLNALDFRLDTNATLVGMATGGKPNSYGEVRSFNLPNSRLVVTYSTKYFHKLRSSDPPAVMPDVTVETSAKESFSRRDPVLEYVINILDH